MGKSAQDASLVEELVMNVKTVAACNGQEHMTKVFFYLKKIFSDTFRIMKLHLFFLELSVDP